jgi:hypothetical protein
MRPVYLTQTGVGTSPVCPLDHYLNPFNVGLSGSVQGSATYSVEYTFDDVYSPTFDPATATWVTHGDLFGMTKTASSNLLFAVTGVRLKVTAGSGTVTLAVIQSGAAS